MTDNNKSIENVGPKMLSPSCLNSEVQDPECHHVSAKILQKIIDRDIGEEIDSQLVYRCSEPV